MASPSAPHPQDLIQQFDDIKFEYSNLKEAFALPPSYKSLEESTELINKIDQWENDIICQVKQIAEQTRAKIRRRSDTITADRFEPEFHRLTEEVNRVQQINNFTESDIQRLTEQLNNLKVQIEDSSLTTAEIRTTVIDWTKHIQIIAKLQKTRRIQKNINFDRLITTDPRISIDVPGADWHTLGGFSSPNLNFLHYQQKDKKKRLAIVNVSGQQKAILWDEDQAIWDSCWSYHLNKFLILADTRLYTYDETETSNAFQRIDTVKPRREEMEFLRFICVDETCLITYDERNSSIDEYNINQWVLVRKHEKVVKSNEIIISLAISETNSNLIGMTILNDKHHWHFELRDRSLLLISSIQLDKNEFNRRILSLPNSNMNWLIIHTGSKVLTIIDENAQSKRTIESYENMDLATYNTDKNCLVFLTQKNKLKFFDL